MSRPILDLRDVSKHYGVGAARVDALTAIDLSAVSGGVMVLVGPSGSGKSTLLHLIGGMDRADAGELSVAGDNLHKLSTAALTVFRPKRLLKLTAQSIEAGVPYHEIEKSTGGGGGGDTE